MGNAHVLRGRLTFGIIVASLAALAVVAALAVTAGPAAAQSGWKHGTATSCSSCHTEALPTAANATIACSTCHTGFTASLKGATPANCTTCHTPGQNLTAVKTNDVTGGCGAASSAAGCHANAGHIGSTPTTCVSCHGVTVDTTDPGQSAHHKTAVTDVTVQALLTIKTSASKVTLGKKVTVSGLAKSVTPGYVVSVVIQKKGTTWKTIATKPATWNQAASSWTLSYKPTKKGAYRFQAKTPQVAGTNGNLTAIPAKVTAYKNLTVK